MSRDIVPENSCCVSNYFFARIGTNFSYRFHPDAYHVYNVVSMYFIGLLVVGLCAKSFS